MEYPKNKQIRLSPYKYKKLQKKVLKRDSFKCQNCGVHTEAPPHHKIFLSHGGSDIIENLVTLCITCHAKAHGRIEK